MASETEKSHALLQSCSTESLLSSLGLGLFCAVADRLLQFPVIQQNAWLRALSDNSVHCVIGMWSWAIVIGIRKKTDFGEIILAGFLASVIDIDHFFAIWIPVFKVQSVFGGDIENVPFAFPVARRKAHTYDVRQHLQSVVCQEDDVAIAFSLQAALSLPRRPFLHCSTVIPTVALTLKFTMHFFKLKDSWCFLPWMLFISWTSHHIRDGIRHGLWICPFGKTSPLPFWLYVIITSSLPHICSFVMYFTGTRQMMSSKHGIHIDV